MGGMALPILGSDCFPAVFSFTELASDQTQGEMFFAQLGCGLLVDPIAGPRRAAATRTHPIPAIATGPPTAGRVFKEYRAAAMSHNGEGWCHLHRKIRSALSCPE